MSLEACAPSSGGRYLKDLKKYDRLPQSEIRSLIAQFQSAPSSPAGIRACKKVIAHNMGLVVSIAKRYWYLMPLEDLLVPGVEGLNRAIEKFDLDSGYQFSTYAVHWVRTYVRRYALLNGRTIALPLHVQERIADIKCCAAAFYTQYQRYPTIAELSQLTEFSEKQIRKVLDAPQGCFPLDQSPPGSESTLLDIIPGRGISPSEAIEHADLRRLVSLLPPEAAQIISLRYGLGGAPMTAQRVGEIIGKSKTHVLRVENRSLFLLRKMLEGAASFAVPQKSKPALAAKPAKQPPSNPAPTLPSVASAVPLVVPSSSRLSPPVAAKLRNELNRLNFAGRPFTIAELEARAGVMLGTIDRFPQLKAEAEATIVKLEKLRGVA